MANDLSLLRPFTLAAIAIGGKVCDPQGNALTEDAAIEILCAEGMEGLRILPMAWLHGRPVYFDSLLFDARNGVTTPAGYFHALHDCIARGKLAWPSRF